LGAGTVESGYLAAVQGRKFTIRCRISLPEKAKDDGRGVSNNVCLGIYADLGGPNSGEFPTFAVEEYSAALAKLREITGISLKNESELDLQSNYSICYAAKPNSLLIRADGTLGKCTVAFSDERNSKGSLNPDGTLKIKQDVWRLWLKGFEDMDSDFLNCPYSKLPSLPVAERTETIDMKILSD